MPTLRPGTDPVLSGQQSVYVAALNWSGQTWMLPSAMNYRDRAITANSLLNGPPPVTPLFGPEDLVASLIPGNFMNVTQLDPRQEDLVRAYLYNQVVLPDDNSDPVPDAPPETPPPAYVPPVPPDPLTDNMHWIVTTLQDLEAQLLWMRKEMTTRRYFAGEPQVFTGEGAFPFPQAHNYGDKYDVDPMGFQIEITAKPANLGASSALGTAIVYRAGDISWGSVGHFSPPVHLSKIYMVIWPIQASGPFFQWNLKPGVSIRVYPLYPVQFGVEPPE